MGERLKDDVEKFGMDVLRVREPVVVFQMGGWGMMCLREVLNVTNGVR